MTAGKLMMLCLTAILSGEETEITHGQIVAVRSQAETEKVIYSLHSDIDPDDPIRPGPRDSVLPTLVPWE